MVGAFGPKMLRLATRHADDLKNFDFVDTPAQIVAQMRLFIDAGITMFMLDCAGFPDLAYLRLVIEETLSKIARYRVLNPVCG